MMFIEPIDEQKTRKILLRIFIVCKMYFKRISFAFIYITEIN